MEQAGNRIKTPMYRFAKRLKGRNLKEAGNNLSYLPLLKESNIKRWLFFCFQTIN